LATTVWARTPPGPSSGCRTNPCRCHLRTSAPGRLFRNTGSVCDLPATEIVSAKRAAPNHQRGTSESTPRSSSTTTSRSTTTTTGGESGRVRLREAADFAGPDEPLRDPDFAEPDRRLWHGRRDYLSAQALVAHHKCQPRFHSRS